MLLREALSPYLKRETSSSCGMLRFYCLFRYEHNFMNTHKYLARLTQLINQCLSLKLIDIRGPSQFNDLGPVVTSGDINLKLHKLRLPLSMDYP